MISRVGVRCADEELTTMRRVARGLLVAGAMLLVLSPRPARADGFFVPWIGSAFVQDPDNTGRLSAGASVGSIGSGSMLGFDVDFGYTPSFFGDESAVGGTNNVVTLMANLIAGPSIETSGGKGVRPYATFGIGLIHPKVVAGSDNNFGWNAAGEVMGFFSSRIGVRGDLRYFHTVNNTSVANTIQLEPGTFHFWRASVGVIFR